MREQRCVAFRRKRKSGVRICSRPLPRSRSLRRRRALTRGRKEIRIAIGGGFIEVFWVGMEAGWQNPNFCFFEMARGSPLIGPDPVTKYGTLRKVGNTGLQLRTRSDPVWIPNKLLASNISGSDPIYLSVNGTRTGERDLVVVLLASRFSLTYALYETIHLLPRFNHAASLWVTCGRGI